MKRSHSSPHKQTHRRTILIGDLRLESESNDFLKGAAALTSDALSTAFFSFSLGECFAVVGLAVCLSELEELGVVLGLEG